MSWRAPSADQPQPIGLAELWTSTDARYGISSFVYSARRPFHPRRLWDLVSAPFCVIQTEYEEEDEEDEEDDEEEGAEGEACALNGDGDVEMDEDKAKEEALARMEEQKAELDLPARAKCKRESPIWKGVLRSKGFIWLATRPHVHGEWSQAGVSERPMVLVIMPRFGADRRSCSPLEAVDRGCAGCPRTNGPEEGTRKSSTPSSWTLWASGVTVDRNVSTIRRPVSSAVALNLSRLHRAGLEQGGHHEGPQRCRSD